MATLVSREEVQAIVTAALWFDCHPFCESRQGLLCDCGKPAREAMADEILKKLEALPTYGQGMTNDRPGGAYAVGG